MNARGWSLGAVDRVSRRITTIVIVIGLWFCASLALHDRAASLAMRGSRQLLQKDYPAATASFRAAVQLPGFDALHRYGYAVALFQNGTEANEVLRQLRSAPPDDEVANAIGICLLVQGDTNGSIREFRKAIADRGDYAVYHHNLSIALTRTGDSQEANAERKRAFHFSGGASTKWSGLYFAPPWGMRETEVIPSIR